ncbi:MAG: hypothetical protein ACD_19C00176G0075 [uncultured bacterium]|nr:MAG: hypothetical protein ACD_19C00176G0075 [uncultured bacterium]
MKDKFNELKARIEEAVQNSEEGGSLNYLVKPIAIATVVALGMQATLSKGDMTPEELEQIMEIKNKALESIV